jgi:general secretion pathway protein N
MKIELASLRTWWVGGIALWAAAVWVATLFGLGTRIAPLDADALTAPPLPHLAPAVPDRITSAQAYADIAARPLFSEDRKPRPYLLGGSEPGTTSSAVTLTGVLLTSEFGMAILTTDQKQSLRLRLNGEAVNGWQLVALEPRSATVSGPGGTQTLELVTFSGQGGEPPTVLGTNVAAAASNPGTRPPGVPVPPPSPPQAGRPTAPVAAPPPAPAPAGQNTAAPASQGPSEAQMQAIRARIQARRQQLQQQQQQSQRPPAGGSGQNP